LKCYWFVNHWNPWFRGGASWSDGVETGVFAFYHAFGSDGYSVSFRVVVIFTMILRIRFNRFLSCGLSIQIILGFIVGHALPMVWVLRCLLLVILKAMKQLFEVFALLYYEQYCLKINKLFIKIVIIEF
jgi:hypothetical protein